MIFGFPQDEVITAIVPDSQTSSPQIPCSSSESDTENDNENSPSAYEKAAMKRREENRQLLKTLGLLKLYICNIIILQI